MDYIGTGVPNCEPTQAVMAPGFNIEGFVLGTTVADGKGAVNWALKNEDGYSMLPRGKNQLNARGLG